MNSILFFIIFHFLVLAILASPSTYTVPHKSKSSSIKASTEESIETCRTYVVDKLNECSSNVMFSHLLDFHLHDHPLRTDSISCDKVLQNTVKDVQARLKKQSLRRTKQLITKECAKQMDHPF